MKKTLQFSIAILSIFCATVAYSQSKISTIQGYLSSHSADWKLTPRDFNDIEITNEAPSKSKDVVHVYIRQKLNGLPVVNGVGTVTLKNNQIIRVVQRFVKLDAAFPIQPTISATQAISSALRQLGDFSTHNLVLKSENKSLQSAIYEAQTASLEPIPVRLMTQVNSAGTTELVYDLSILMPSQQNWWSVRVSAIDGTILFKNDWIQHCSFDDCASTLHDHETEIATTEQNQMMLPPPPPGADQYTVYALPVISPNHGNRTTLINPSDPIYSPLGWHDSNGITGDENTTTIGNNVLASDDANDDDIPGYSPDGGAGLNFDFPYDSAVGVQGNLNSVITNLFYMNNMMHDIYAYYGFDEESGNFQNYNYSGFGVGNDFVFADAQDGSGTNNANFGTPPEGSNPRMQMFLWSSSQPVDLVTVNSPANIAMSYGALEAGFGPSVPTTPLTADVVLLIDNDGDVNDGCGTIQNAAAMVGKIVLIRRGTCPFVQKVQAAQDAGAIAVIMMNNVAGGPIQMGGSSTTITITSVMISQADGTTFTTSLSNGDTINATLQNPGDITAYDSDFDNLIISHEYGHGISNRLTGGANNSNCLFNAEQMGEGWSDWLGLMITMKPGDLGSNRRGVGTYVTGAANNATGIRPAPYSTSFSVNNFTYANTNSGVSQPHGIGFVWATMLWDLNWDLINQYGFDSDVKTGTGGNNIAMALVIEGMKLQPCAPGFVDGRDAILAADSLLYNGANHCLIWKAFARRGLGFSADQGSSDDRADQVQAFDLPVECQANAAVDESNIENVRIYPNPTKDFIIIDMNGVSNVSSIQITDLAGKRIFSSENITTSTLKVDLSNYKSGIYLVQLTDKNGAKTIEIVKH